jgi:hypothetical protein
LKRTARIEALVWLLIYGGLIGAALGVALARNGASYGDAVVALGTLAVAAGIVLLWARSRLPES